MTYLNELLQEVGISKVKLAKYLGVSRQMIYNYLELENLNKWPKEKKILLFKLFDIQDGDEETLKKINLTNADYIHLDVMDNTFVDNASLTNEEIIKLCHDDEHKYEGKDKFIKYLSDNRNK